MPVTCFFCKMDVPDVQAAIDKGWIPSFYIAGDREVSEPVCPECADAHLVGDEVGDSELKPGEDPVVLCHLCRKAARLSAAVEVGWFPSVVRSPSDPGSGCDLCPTCGDKHLDADCVVKPESLHLFPAE